MFAYCNNNPANCVDSDGNLPIRNTNLIHNDGRGHYAPEVESENATSSDMGSNANIYAVTKKVKSLRRTIKTIIRAIGSSIEANVGVGLGTHFEGTVGNIGISVGNSGNYIEFAVDDGKFSTYSTYSEAICVSLAIFSVGPSSTVIRDFSWNEVASEDVTYFRISDTISITGGKAYLIGGASWELSFNFIEFINTLSKEFNL